GELAAAFKLAAVESEFNGFPPMANSARFGTPSPSGSPRAPPTFGSASCASVKRASAQSPNVPGEARSKKESSTTCTLLELVVKFGSYELVMYNSALVAYTGGYKLTSSVVVGAMVPE